MASTNAPQRQLCGTQRFEPRRRLTATRTAIIIIIIIILTLK